MSVLGEVFDSLKSMSLLQLLLAFVACIAYALAQGSLLGPRGRSGAWFSTFAAASGFVFLSQEWPNAVMLLAVAVAGLGLVGVAAWFTARLLGIDSSAMPVAEPTMPAALDPLLAKPGSGLINPGQPLAGA